MFQPSGVPCRARARRLVFVLFLGFLLAGGSVLPRLIPAYIPRPEGKAVMQRQLVGMDASAHATRQLERFGRDNAMRARRDQVKRLKGYSEAHMVALQLKQPAAAPRGLKQRGLALLDSLLRGRDAHAQGCASRVNRDLAGGARRRQRSRP